MGGAEGKGSKSDDGEGKMQVSFSYQGDCRNVQSNKISSTIIKKKSWISFILGS